MLLVRALLLAHVGASLLLLLCLAAVVAGQRLRRSPGSAHRTQAGPAHAFPADPVTRTVPVPEQPAGPVPTEPVPAPALSVSRG